MNTIERSKKGAAERSAENYMEAVNTTVMREKVKHNDVVDGVYNIQSDGSLCLSGTTCTEETAIKIEGSGDMPSSGSLVIQDGIVVGTNGTTTTNMQIKDYIVSYDSEAKAYVASIIESICTYVPETGTIEKTVGAKYSCVLEDGEPRTFYVLENIESSKNISLIMDRNFTDTKVSKTLAWCIYGGGDYTTCQSINSKEAGTPLKYIQDTFGSNVEVSFPTKDQIVNANNGKTSNLPQWLYDHLNGTTHPVSGVSGYWTASPYADYTNRAWNVRYNGNMNDYSAGSSSGYGVRPVITVSKDQLK